MCAVSSPVKTVWNVGAASTSSDEEYTVSPPSGWCLCSMRWLTQAMVTATNWSNRRSTIDWRLSTSRRWSAARGMPGTWQVRRRLLLVFTRPPRRTSKTPRRRSASSWSPRRYLTTNYTAHRPAPSTVSTIPIPIIHLSCRTSACAAAIYAKHDIFIPVFLYCLSGILRWNGEIYHQNFHSLISL